jgi:hypothetical protein
MYRHNFTWYKLASLFPFNDIADLFGTTACAHLCAAVARTGALRRAQMLQQFCWLEANPSVRELFTIGQYRGLDYSANHIVRPIANWMLRPALHAVANSTNIHSDVRLSQWLTVLTRWFQSRVVLVLGSIPGRTLTSCTIYNNCGQAVNFQLPWRGYEAVHEGCDHWFVFTMYNPDCTVAHVRHLRLSLRLFVRKALKSIR